MADRAARGGPPPDRRRRGARLRDQRRRRRGAVHVLVPGHRRSRATARADGVMGLLDYYRQFDDMSEAEISERLLRKRDEERAKALAHIPTIDLSSTEWPDLPNSEVMNASIFIAGGRINGYPDRHAEKLRRRLAARHRIDPERIVVGNGAAELLQAAAYALLSGGGELVTPWPSYPLYPLMAARAGGRPVAVDM